MNCNDVSNVLASTNSDLAEAIDCKRKRNNQIEIGLRKSTSMDMFPWMMEFRKMCRSSVAQRGPSLIKLIRSFNRNVSLNVNDCYKKSSRAAKLKELIKEALLLFMYFHRFEQPQDQNRAVYLEQMSDLLAVYIDLELVASKRDIEPQHKKISARLVSYLFIYLDNSTEFVLETLIKVQLVNETHGHVLDAIISKIFKIISKHPESEIMYVRYLLIYRIWKKVHSNLAVKKQINTNAISSLGSFPANMPKILLEQVLPSVPSTQATISESQSTKFYLCHPFDLRKACNQFMEYCRKSRNDEGTSPADDITERDPRELLCLSSINENYIKEKNKLELNEDISVNSILFKMTSSSSQVNNINPTKEYNKAALQVEVSSTDLTSNSVNKTQQDQDTSSPDLLPYILDNTVQNNFENNNNDSVILNGETVMLLQKPNGNLYIINKAAVDNGKLNYNSDDEDANRFAETENPKCCRQETIIKHDNKKMTSSSSQVNNINLTKEYSDVYTSNRQFQIKSFICIPIKDGFFNIQQFEIELQTKSFSNLQKLKKSYIFDKTITYKSGSKKKHDKVILNCNVLMLMWTLINNVCATVSNLKNIKKRRSRKANILKVKWKLSISLWIEGYS